MSDGSDDDDLATRIAALTPARRELFLRTLAGRKLRPTSREAGHETSCDPASDDRSSAGPLPLLEGQYRLWLTEQANPDGTGYCLFVPVRLTGPLNVDAFEGSLRTIIGRHDALRARFGEEAGVPFVRHEAAYVFRVELLDRRHVLPEQRAPMESALADREARRPFDLESGPLVRAVLARWEQHEASLLLAVHHIAADNWSMGVFRSELEALYSAAVEGRPPPRLARAWRHRELLASERARQKPSVVERHLEWWEAQLAGAPARSTFPADHSRSRQPSPRGDRVALRIDAEHTSALQALARRNGATPFMVVVAAIAGLLQRSSGQDDVVVGADVVHRMGAGEERAIGFFANQIALRVDVSANPTASELVRRVVRTCVEAYAHGEVSFLHVSERCRGAGERHAPLFQVKVVFLTFDPTRLELAGVSGAPLKQWSGTPKFDVELVLWREAAELHGFLEYITDRFRRGTAERLVRQLQELLLAMGEHEQHRLDDISLGSMPSVRRVSFQRERFPFEA